MQDQTLNPEKLLSPQEDLPLLPQESKSVSSHLKFHARNTKLLGLVLIALVAAVISGGYGYYRYQFSQAPATIAEVSSSGSTLLALNPPNINPTLANETATLDLVVNSGSEHLTGIYVELNYDPNKLEIVSFTPTSYLPTTILAPKIEEGKVTATLGAALSSGGVAGQGTIATITLKVKENGSLNISDSSEAYTTEQENNTLKSVSGTVFVIGSEEPVVTSSPSTTPSTDPSTTPSTTPTATPSTTTTTLTTKFDPTCTSITYKWDKITNASGYYVDISTTSDFKDFTSSGQLGSDKGEVTFYDLKNNTTYYARLTLVDIPDFPQYNYAKAATTKCGTASADIKTSPTATPVPPTPKPTIKATATPKPTIKSSPTPKPTTTSSPKQSPLASPATQIGQSVGSAVGGDLGTTINPSLPPASTERPMSFIQWFFAQIGRILGR